MKITTDQLRRMIKEEMLDLKESLQINEFKASVDELSTEEKAQYHEALEWFMNNLDKMKAEGWKYVKDRWQSYGPGSVTYSSDGTYKNEDQPDWDPFFVINSVRKTIMSYKQSHASIEMTWPEVRDIAMEKGWRHIYKFNFLIAEKILNHPEWKEFEKEILKFVDVLELWVKKELNFGAKLNTLIDDAARRGDFDSLKQAISLADSLGLL